ncbi:hypothetical protein P691DRAFT_544416 [Macrolepiota fuliginosa MF-IS2]|uniref:Uncharacterized protein n=1 Tax=Macrolepiota fuliginosa MF-IS2 TaxID=1400762 RepID=A0A9P6BXQ4_9AGAR|nr:hypothetical protein P691DRAFT_544416 [Macrolepiota fuliginosa MF-IS2]
MTQFSPAAIWFSANSSGSRSRAITTLSTTFHPNIPKGKVVVRGQEGMVSRSHCGAQFDVSEGVLVAHFSFLPHLPLLHYEQPRHTSTKPVSTAMGSLTPIAAKPHPPDAPVRQGSPCIYFYLAHIPTPVHCSQLTEYTYHVLLCKCLTS